MTNARHKLRYADKLADEYAHIDLAGQPALVVELIHKLRHTRALLRNAERCANRLRARLEGAKRCDDAVQ